MTTTTRTTAIRDPHSAERISQRAVRQSLAQIVVISHGQTITTSIVVAEKFRKRHDNVLQAIANLDCSNGFRLLNFQESSYLNEQGKEQPCYTVTRDGFSFLAMGFTGKEAAVWKEKFIAAFNWQASEINRLSRMHASPDWQQARIEGQTARRDETDAIKAFVSYAQSQGSRSAGKYYLAITKATNRALFFVNAAVGKDFRQGLSAQQLASVAMAERIVERSLLESMSAKTCLQRRLPHRRRARPPVRCANRAVGTGQDAGNAGGCQMTAPKNGEAPSAMARSGAQESRNDTDIIATLVHAIKARIQAGEIVGALDYPEADQPTVLGIASPSFSTTCRVSVRSGARSASSTSTAFGLGRRCSGFARARREALTRRWPEALRSSLSAPG
jgi:Rha family phage regulatory protein